MQILQNNHFAKVTICVDARVNTIKQGEEGNTFYQSTCNFLFVSQMMVCSAIPSLQVI